VPDTSSTPAPFAPEPATNGGEPELDPSPPTVTAAAPVDQPPLPPPVLRKDLESKIIKEGTQTMISCNIEGLKLYFLNLNNMT
jgi:hypothetical protein